MSEKESAKSNSAFAQVNPNVSVDCVIFGFDGTDLKVLVIQRKAKPDDNPKESEFGLALPGNLVRDDESLDQAANRVLFELTGLENIYLEQFHTFGDPHRVKGSRDVEWLSRFRQNPDARVITVAYYSLIKLPSFELEAGSDSFAKKPVWYSVNAVPGLGFDHNLIVNKAIEMLKEKMRFHPIGFELLPKKFTLTQLQKLYEVIIGKPLDKRNFRRRVLNYGFLVPQDEKQTNVSHKPAMLYKFNKKKYEQFFRSDFDF
ncbi:MAG: NUDIX hydrolase [Bacteroidia bacterium]|nr:NUDIX hydrolase [Bacteroidia bacterium]